MNNSDWIAMAGKEQQVSTLNMNPNQKSQPVVLHPKQHQNNGNKNFSAYPSAPPLGGQHQKPYRKKPSFNPNDRNYSSGYQNGSGYHSNSYQSNRNSMATKDFRSSKKDLNYSRPYNSNQSTVTANTDLKYDSAGNSSNTNSTTPPTPSSANNSASTVASPSSNLASPDATSLTNVSNASGGECTNVEATSADSSNSQTETDGPQTGDQQPPAAGPPPPKTVLIEQPSDEKVRATNLARDFANMQVTGGPKQHQSSGGEKHTAPYNSNVSSTMSFKASAPPAYSQHPNSVNSSYHHYGKSHSPHDMPIGGPLGKPVPVSSQNNGYQGGGYHSSYGRPHHAQPGKVHSGSYSNNSNNSYPPSNYHNSNNSNGSLNGGGNYSTYSNKQLGGYRGGHKKTQHSTPHLLNSNGKPGTLNQSSNPNNILLKNAAPSQQHAMRPGNAGPNSAGPNGLSISQNHHSVASPPHQLMPALFYQSSFTAQHQLNQSSAGQQQLPNLQHNAANCIQCLQQNVYNATGQFVAAHSQAPYPPTAFYPPGAQFIAANSLPYQYNAGAMQQAAGEYRSDLVGSNQQPAQQAANSSNAGNNPPNKQQQQQQQQNFVQPPDQLAYLAPQFAYNPYMHFLPPNYYPNPYLTANNESQLVSNYSFLNPQQMLVLQQAQLQQQQAQHPAAGSLSNQAMNQQPPGQQEQQQFAGTTAGSVSALDTITANLENSSRSNSANYDSGGGSGGLLQTAGSGFTGGDQLNAKFAYSANYPPAGEYNPLNSQLNSQLNSHLAWQNQSLLIAADLSSQPPSLNYQPEAGKSAVAGAGSGYNEPSDAVDKK